MDGLLSVASYGSPTTVADRQTSDGVPELREVEGQVPLRARFTGESSRHELGVSGARNRRDGSLSEGGTRSKIEVARV